MNGIDLKQQANRLSDLKDPFMADNVIRFSTYCTKSDYNGAWRYSGTIEFRNGNTKGEQDFDARDYAGLIKKMEVFMAELKANA